MDKDTNGGVVPVILKITKDGGSSSFNAFFDKSRGLFFITLMTAEYAKSYGFTWDEVPEQLSIDDITD